ncbi:hypothetical protein A6V39_04105 [Candidatus Mycoplasma haematobovis]|uniref:Uncharacterized protein n=1 Tax=Candidatus Mycoplasma haematobovis TaxID=432608 RepID=A0A1A9QBW7_9MOLU|nr:hypothetical protein [Candidatus Mycoplasma haematobovis]OAL10072.1 hypothetical protein A6V39_04105 [Candidatus Mycoplasma haematobovis]
MILKILSKTAIAGSTVYLSTNVSVANELLTKPISLSKVNLPKKITSLEDIKIYEKFNNCKFTFVEKWRGSVIYTANEFLAKHKDKEKIWKNKIIEGAEIYRTYCTNGRVITLSNVAWRGGSGFRIDPRELPPSD